MFGNIDINLTEENNKPFYYSKLKIKKIKEELEKFLKENEDLKKIDELRIMKSIDAFVEPSRKKNYFQIEGFLFNHKEINEELINEIHTKIIPEENTYRREDVYIMNSSYNSLPSMDKGLPHELIGIKIEELLKYINNSKDKSEINDFIKSQIISFYLVYIHPYNDGNGRLSRTISKWYLLNNDKYYLSLVNRGILSSKEEYKKSIIKSRKKDLSPFIEYSLKTLLKELKIEKEILLLEKDRKISFNDNEYKALQYLFHIKNKTLDSLSKTISYYEGYNKKDEFIKKSIYPLLEKGIIRIEDGTIIINTFLEEKRKNK